MTQKKLCPYYSSTEIMAEFQGNWWIKPLRIKGVTTIGPGLASSFSELPSSLRFLTPHMPPYTEIPQNSLEEVIMVLNTRVCRRPGRAG